MDIRYPSPGSMFIRNCIGGAELEGRATRKGAGSMKISAYSRTWEVTDLQWSTIAVPEIPMPMKQVRYTIHGTTFLPIEKFINNVKRLDTLGFWLLSYQEVIRHLALAQNYVQSPRWKSMMEIASAEFDNIKDTFLKYLDICLHADTSIDQFTYYVKEHADSASPFGGRWADLLDKPGLLKLAHERTIDWMRAYRDWYNRAVNASDTLLINARYTYPGVRARPADYVFRPIGDFEYIAYAEKFRDRKVGGVPGESQMTFPIFNSPDHAKADDCFLKFAERLLGVPIRDLGIHGPIVYQELMNEDKEQLFIYDGKTQEKQTGLLFHNHGWAVDLSHPRFEPAFGPEMYSGIGITKPLNLAALAIYVKAEMDDNGFNPTKMYSFSDNIAFVGAKPPPSIHIDPTTEFCGFNPTLKRFGPPSLTTDNPKHRIQFKNNTQKQVQRMQYDMRPGLAVIMNDMVPGTCERFINHVVSKGYMKIGETDQMLQDDMKELLLSSDATVHESIRSEFSDAFEYVKRWFVVQDRDPNFTTDLRISM